MSVRIRLSPLSEETHFAPLGVLGYCLRQTDFLGPLWAELPVGLKVVDYGLDAKLTAVVLSILAGCRALAQINTRLRPDSALTRAWGYNHLPRPILGGANPGCLWQ